MTDYRVDVQNPDDAERLVIWLNRTRALNVAMPAEGGTVVTFDQAAYDWLADQDEPVSFRVEAYGDLSQDGMAQLWVEDEDRFAVWQVTP